MKAGGGRRGLVTPLLGHAARRKGSRRRGGENWRRPWKPADDACTGAGRAHAGSQARRFEA
eukprot:4517691-Pyramimonas_sp.AAC.1